MKNEETLLHILDGSGLILLANLFYTQKLRGIIRNPESCIYHGHHH